MKLEPVKLLRVGLEFIEGRRIPVGRLARRAHQLLFEYDPEFLRTRLELSPLRLPARPGVTVGNPAKFDGLMGVFDDSLPDGWGRLLIDRRAAKAGITSSSLGPLDRLAIIGSRGMGALVYEPDEASDPPTVVNLAEIEADTQAVLREAKQVDLDRLIALGGSPHGARPKALVQLSADGTLTFGERGFIAGSTHHLVKFRAERDDKHSGTLEHAYMLMAAAAGLDVPGSTMLGRTRDSPGYFAVRRFDRTERRRQHLHTLAGLLEAPPRSTALTYADLLKATRQLTRDESAVAEMFRRACFNVFAHNRDDHSRNFAFLMDESGAWRASPAYDLTYSDGPGGEHTLLVDTEGADPSRKHLVALAVSADVRRADEVIDQVEEAVRRFPSFADEARLPKKVAAAIAKKLGIAIAPTRRRR